VTHTFRFAQILSFSNEQLVGQIASQRIMRATPGTKVFKEISDVCGVTHLGPHVNSPPRVAAGHFIASKSRTQRGKRRS
jgi:hypothetical protein